ncbi:MAG: diaminopimelate decarboxylase, partial [Mucilaginibacter sp.]|nr:diaminopimelate decarboxylase [Mucilaginibacter sp.]
MFNTNTITRFQQLETPFYYYHLDVLRQTLEACRTASSKYGFHVHYAMKANFNPKVLVIIREYGFGADCVRGNEVKAAIALNFGKENVVF